MSQAERAELVGALVRLVGWWVGGQQMFLAKAGKNQLHESCKEVLTKDVPFSLLSLLFSKKLLTSFCKGGRFYSFSNKTKTATCHRTEKRAGVVNDPDAVLAKTDALGRQLRLAVAWTSESDDCWNWSCHVPGMKGRSGV